MTESEPLAPHEQHRPATLATYRQAAKAKVASPGLEGAGTAKPLRVADDRGASHQGRGPGFSPVSMPVAGQPAYGIILLS